MKDAMVIGAFDSNSPKKGRDLVDFLSHLFKNQIEAY
jgi:hypothetical protein